MPPCLGIRIIALEHALVKPQHGLYQKHGKGKAFNSDIINAIIIVVDDLLEEIGRNPRNVRFSDLVKLCDHYFGEPRRRGSHLYYKTPWRGTPLVNIQPRRGMAKVYQVHQVLRAIAMLEERG